MLYCYIDSKLKSNYVSSLRTFLALFNVKRNFLTFSKSFEAFRSDSTEVNEYVSAAVILSNETETFLFVEPLNDTSCVRHDSLLNFRNNSQ
ncbi:hypothetical protein P3TCK_02306 [Photobacterium profundum 3TCK]|uniref:Uncharacterized protein n=1 Tax=Photobacterium profundum 3TCK TaxID=314280 RepID=Q1YXA6_9GAMM|nr:hypothetical protein P3TCK_02306 [Photobacterium profundum 3TCK]